ncbi:hypothetical protein K2X33_16225, partial [bacterium]|nr:hypothetical protein [bacterium]
RRGVQLLAVTLGVLPLVLSCNLYQPLSSAGDSVDEILEEARSYLHAGDYAGAITQYERLPTGELRTEKLCVVNLARGGLDLSVMMETLTNNTSDASFTMLGQLANDLVPFTDEKLTAAETARTQCAAFTVTTRTTKLLKILSLFVDCGMRMARTDKWVSDTGGVTASCNSTTPGNNSGAITDADIGGNGGGTLSAGFPGMCDYDALQCASDLDTAANTNILSDGLDVLNDNLGLIPSDFLGGSPVADAVRNAMKDTLE